MSQAARNVKQTNVDEICGRDNESERLLQVATTTGIGDRQERLADPCFNVP